MLGCLYLACRDWKHRSRAAKTSQVHQAVWLIRSAVVTTGMLSVAFLALVSCLNLQGYMNTRPSTGFVPPGYVRRLRISSIARYSEPGAVFDSRFALRTLLPTLLHTCTIALLNKMYQRVSKWLTDREGHLREQDAQSQLVFKRVLFEAMDMYLPLIYVTASLGGGQRDHMIKSFMMSMYLSEELRRIATESVVPLLFQRRREGGDARRKAAAEIARVHAQSPEAKNAPATAPHIDEYEHARRRIIANSEREKPPYGSQEIFNDYLEMVLQFGYVSLWSDHFPLAPLLSIVHNLAEVRSDAFKVCFLHRRGVPSTQGSGRLLSQWLPVLKLIAAVATAKNVWRLCRPATW